MAVFVPADWLTMTYVVFWFIWAVIFIVWIFLYYDAFMSSVPLVISLTFLLTLIGFMPFPESLYAYFEDSDPFNSAPYIQWVSMQLRFMLLSTFSFYLITVVAEPWWKPGSGARRAIKWISIVPFVSLFVLGGVIIGDKPNAFILQDEPYQAFAYILDWMWPFISILGTMTSAGVLLWYQADKPTMDDGKPMDTRMHAFASLVINMFVFFGSTSLALVNVVDRDTYNGSVQYYFQQQRWIENVAPYFTFAYLIPMYFIFIGYLFVMMRAHNMSAYGMKNQPGWSKVPDRDAPRRSTRSSRR